MIYFANAIHPFTGNRKLVIIQSQYPMDVKAYLEEIKKKELLVYSADPYTEFFNVSHAECIDIPAIERVRYLESLLLEVVEKKKLTKKMKKAIEGYFGNE